MLGQVVTIQPVGTVISSLEKNDEATLDGVEQVDVTNENPICKCSMASLRRVWEFRIAFTAKGQMVEWKADFEWERVKSDRSLLFAMHILDSAGQTKLRMTQGTSELHFSDADGTEICRVERYKSNWLCRPQHISITFGKILGPQERMPLLGTVFGIMNTMNIEEVGKASKMMMPIAMVTCIKEVYRGKGCKSMLEQVVTIQPVGTVISSYEKNNEEPLDGVDQVDATDIPICKCTMAYLRREFDFRIAFSAKGQPVEWKAYFEWERLKSDSSLYVAMKIRDSAGQTKLRTIQSRHTSYLTACLPGFDRSLSVEDEHGVVLAKATPVPDRSCSRLYRPWDLELMSTGRKLHVKLNMTSWCHGTSELHFSDAGGTEICRVERYKSNWLCRPQHLSITFGQSLAPQERMPLLGIVFGIIYAMGREEGIKILKMIMSIAMVLAVVDCIWLYTLLY